MFRRKYRNSVSVLWKSPQCDFPDSGNEEKKNKGIFQRKILEQTTEKPVFGEAPQLAKQWFKIRRYHCVYEDRLFYLLKCNLLLDETYGEHQHVVDVKCSIHSQKPKDKPFPAAFEVSSVRTVSCKGNSISML